MFKSSIRLQNVVFWKAVGDFTLSSDYVWLSVTLDSGQTGEKPEKLAGLRVIPLADWNEEIRRPSAFLERKHHFEVVTEQSSKKLVMFHLAVQIRKRLCDYRIPGNDASHYKAL